MLKTSPRNQIHPFLNPHKTSDCRSGEDTLNSDMPELLKERLKRQGYHILGERGAFKACQWQRKSLVEGQSCYKERFYGIESHRCLQMTPVVDKCTHACRFCWRVTPGDIGISWDQVSVSSKDVLPPDELLESTMKANIRSLGGYNPEIKRGISKDKYDEARNPKHLAISLAGEPTLYPFLGDLIEEAGKRDMTTFLVTNGTRPLVLESITQPTQLYITLAAPDEKTYRTLCRPVQRGSWAKIQESQELLQSLPGRKVNRLTMVAGLNMHEPRKYADMILLGEPDFVEVKGYMFLGSSRDRLDNTNAPSHRDIRAFSGKLADLTGYSMQDEQIESRVVLLSSGKKKGKIV